MNEVTGLASTERELYVSDYAASLVKVYDTETLQELRWWTVCRMPMPAPFKKLTRIKYFPNTDVMYLAGYTLEHPHTGQEWGIVGTEIVPYDDWSQSRKLRWHLPLPYNPTAQLAVIIKAMDVAGNRVFAGDCRTAKVYVYDADTGKSIMTLSPGAEVENESGWIDTPYGLRAYQRFNGEYIVFVEKVAKAKVIMYRFNPDT